MYAARLITDCRVNTSVIVGRGGGDFLGILNPSSNAFEDSDPAEDDGRNKAAEDSS